MILERDFPGAAPWGTATAIHGCAHTGSDNDRSVGAPARRSGGYGIMRRVLRSAIASPPGPRVGGPWCHPSGIARLRRWLLSPWRQVVRCPLAKRPPSRRTVRWTRRASVKDLHLDANVACSQSWRINRSRVAAIARACRIDVARGCNSATVAVGFAATFAILRSRGRNPLALRGLMMPHSLRPRRRMPVGRGAVMSPTPPANCRGA